jgi:hypothetical protein
MRTNKFHSIIFDITERINYRSFHKLQMTLNVNIEDRKSISFLQ